MRMENDLAEGFAVSTAAGESSHGPGSFQHGAESKAVFQRPRSSPTLSELRPYLAVVHRIMKYLAGKVCSQMFLSMRRSRAGPHEDESSASIRFLS